jgi:hypothetical protein
MVGSAVQGDRELTHAHADGRRHVDAAGEWRSKLAVVVGGLLLFEVLSGLIILFWPFGRWPQTALLLHVAVGIVGLPAIGWYLQRHWRARRHGNLSHHQVLGYASALMLALCVLSGVAETWQASVGPEISVGWDQLHLVSGLALIVLLAAHLATTIVRSTRSSPTRSALSSARRSYAWGSISIAAAGLIVTALWAAAYGGSDPRIAFADGYNWILGEDRPFAPSLVRNDVSGWERRVTDRLLEAVDDAHRPLLLASLDSEESAPMGLFPRVRRFLDQSELDETTRSGVESELARAAREMREEGAIRPAHLAGSERCGSCHEQIYREWLPSAHRYASMDALFQRVQEIMVAETSPEHTRYCAGCHDPISLLGGAKNRDNITLSALGADEGVSCVVCHSIVQADVQGNGDYVIHPPERYMHELDDGPVTGFLADFLIRAYPRHHVASYSRPLYRTAEFCGACHKQYMDREINTDIGKVQGQNQYDSWRNSRWHHGRDDPRTLGCRECHMPLQESADPARGDSVDLNRTASDSAHRSHRMLGGNQYVPILHGLEGAEEHVRLTESWLRGERSIPEIADRWTEGPVVRIDIDAPASVREGEQAALRIVLTNNKTGHDFPTGPLDMIESWIEVLVTDDSGSIIYHSGAIDDDAQIDGTLAHYRADAFDRHGAPIDRHNLWDLVGKSYSRTIYPGVTDGAELSLRCPSMWRGRLSPPNRQAPGSREQRLDVTASADGAVPRLLVTARLWYRKANPAFLDRVYGAGSGVRSPVTLMSTASASIAVEPRSPAIGLDRPAGAGHE